MLPVFNSTSGSVLSCSSKCIGKVYDNKEFGIATSFVGLLLLWALVVNRKGLPLAHSLRLLPALCRLLWPRLFHKGNNISARPDSTSKGPSGSELRLSARPELFRRKTARSSATLSDLDINIHKSNSTFFADADSNRANLLSEQLSSALARLGPANFILAATQCRFLREIGPFKAYDISSGILTWDDKSLYVATYFLKPGANIPTDLEQQEGTAALLKHEVYRKIFFASVITRFVFKSGRKTITPVEVLKEAELLVEAQQDGGKDLVAPQVLSKLVANGSTFVDECMH